MSETTIEHEPVEEPTGGGMPSAASDEQLVAMLVDRARSEGLQLTGEGGLLQMLTKRVLESALEGEITDHLGYEKHDPAAKNNGNSRNGTRAKTVLGGRPLDVFRIAFDGRLSPGDNCLLGKGGQSLSRCGRISPRSRDRSGA